jgi:hypothetical protein
MTDHDTLFKKLLQNFFPEFIELFFPDISGFWERDSIKFLPQEVFTDVKEGEKRIIDILVQANFKQQDTLFVIHIEHQSYTQTNFNKRMFCYYARLYEEYGLPIYPIVIYSHDLPKTTEPSSLNIDFLGWKVVEFNYRVVQLNQLNWQDFVNQRNPIASALMSKMQMGVEERPTVKLLSLQLLTSLGLNVAQVEQISVFIDTYLKLNTSEERVFEEQIATIEPRQKEQVMEIVTSWMEKGIEQGMQRGMQRGMQQEAASLVLRQLKRRFGDLTQPQQERIQNLSTVELENLGEALLDFTDSADLQTWLNSRV